MDDRRWLRSAMGDIVTRVDRLAPSEWAEQNRRLPATSPMPGLYRYEVTPYLREPVDCLDPRCDVQEITCMKGAQIGWTVGVIENGIGYYVSQVRTAPQMMMTATQDLAKIRLEEYVLPMLADSNLDDLIQSNVEVSNRRSGLTARKVSHYGGGFLQVNGAREAAPLCSVSIRVVWEDEVDRFPESAGKDGDPCALVERRTNGFEFSKKIVRCSTPLIEHNSKIYAHYLEGDQRKYHVPCLGCGVEQVIRWRVDDESGKKVGGITWKIDDDGTLIPGSARWTCPECQHQHINEDKDELLARGRWVATAVPKHPKKRSYQISGLYSPSMFFTWEAAVLAWQAAWDDQLQQMRSRAKLQEFYNGVLGVPFAEGGVKLTLTKVAQHARDYEKHTVPNTLAATMCDGPIAILICSVDVQDAWLDVAVYAFGPKRVGFLVDRARLEGDTVDPNGGPWKALREMLDTAEYPSDDGERVYSIGFSVVDSRHNSAAAYEFCASYGPRIAPITGRGRRASGSSPEFTPMKNASIVGTRGWGITVDHYKGRLAQLLRDKPTPDLAPAVVESVSFYESLDDADLKELIGEELIEEIDARTGMSKWVWKRVATRNELWDLTVYAKAAMDIFGYMLCREQYQMDVVDWSFVWNWCEGEQYCWGQAPPRPPPDTRPPTAV